MQTYIITKKDLDKENFYIGKTDLSDFAGHIESEENLGRVRFKTYLRCTGRVLFRAGSGISAGGGISAGWSISAGDSISAGWGISAGGGISAGLAIECKVLKSDLRIFAGIARWKIPKKEEMQIRCEVLEKGEIAFGELVIKAADLPAPAVSGAYPIDDHVVVGGVKCRLVKEEAANGQA
jgi:hypothetical protein